MKYKPGELIVFRKYMGYMKDSRWKVGVVVEVGDKVMVVCIRSGRSELMYCSLVGYRTNDIRLLDRGNVKAIRNLFRLGALFSNRMIREDWRRLMA
jgi:hypothetical protein